MGSSKDQVLCNLKPARKAKGLSQVELAARVGVKRQAVYDMESQRYVPNTALALRLAKELDCRVEDLFALDESENELTLMLDEEINPADSRVSLFRVRQRLISYPLDNKWLLSDGFRAADGLLKPDGRSVTLLQTEDYLEKSALLLGCDPAFAILSAHVARKTKEAGVHCRFASSHGAVAALAAGRAHAAGTHLHNAGTSESNLALAEKLVPGTKVVVFAFSIFEEGLMVAPGNPCGIRSVADLADGRIRLVNREPGAALRVLLDDCLVRAGIPAEIINGYDSLAGSHVQGAQMVTFGLADAALGLKAVAAAYGLDFVPIQAVRCDLVIPADLLDHPGIKVVLDVLQTHSLRRELAALPGYESSCTGQIIGGVGCERPQNSLFRLSPNGAL
ncbi:MAG: helix-turn-helix domain-containing protein [Deltaproteobacteria bacterium]|nr:helix-turn-helix domain-containing protein [Deltaproteobacteria bacterium]MBF0527245.1 helix-turn-helix domain-containing protein [Deltaproteobacteria bacterium]